MGTSHQLLQFMETLITWFALSQGGAIKQGFSPQTHIIHAEYTILQNIFLCLSIINATYTGIRRNMQNSQKEGGFKVRSINSFTVSHPQESISAVIIFSLNKNLWLNEVIFRSGFIQLTNHWNPKFISIWFLRRPKFYWDEVQFAFQANDLPEDCKTQPGVFWTVEWMRVWY